MNARKIQKSLYFGFGKTYTLLKKLLHYICDYEFFKNLNPFWFFFFFQKIEQILS